MDRTYGVSDIIITERMTAIGQVKAGACKLHWVSCAPAFPGSEIDISDAIEAGVTPLLEHYHDSREGHIDSFLPPCPFTTGIYLEKFDKMTSVTFGYSV